MKRLEFHIKGKSIILKNAHSEEKLIIINHQFHMEFTLSCNHNSQLTMDEASSSHEDDLKPRFTGSADSSSILAGIKGLRKTGRFEQTAAKGIGLALTVQYILLADYRIGCRRA